MRNIVLFIGLLVTYQVSGQSIEKSSIDSGGGSFTAGNIEVLYTIGEVAIAEVSAGNIILSEGFINPILIKLNAKMFLEGTYENGSASMWDDLRDSGLIPTSTPYIDGLVTNADVFNIGGSLGTGSPEDDIVDWVWIELRDSSDNTSVVSSRSALLQRDGDVVEIDGINLMTMDVPVGNYYLSVSHRNHLGVISDNTVGFSSGVNEFDFTLSDTVVSGGSNALTSFGDGKYGLYSGDFNGDGQVQNTDKIAVEQERGLNGYRNADIDMNGEVQNTDLNNLLIPNLGKGVQFTKMHLQAKRKETKKN